VARRLGFHLLDSGALYRATALAAQDAGVSLDDEAPLAELAGRLALRFEGQRVYLAGRTSPTRCAWNPPAAWPRGCRCTRRAPGPAPAAAVLPPGPGLVADGRDMGTVIFPGARSRCFSPPAPSSAPSGAISS
jgi:3-phosphoshikimate 1-carboxyvinyltransferase